MWNVFDNQSVKDSQNSFDIEHSHIWWTIESVSIKTEMTINDIFYSNFMLDFISRENIMLKASIENFNNLLSFHVVYIFWK